MPPPTFLLPDAPIVFPDPIDADTEGLVAVGGDLSPERLLRAYENGIFPWYEDGLPPLWWSPDPRAVISVETLHVSRRLERRLRQGRFTFTWDRAFDDVMRACAELRDGGTWIIDEMFAAYALLHRLGYAHSLEVWSENELVGGFYGVRCGALFAGESMFHRETDASKAALVAGVRSLSARGVSLFDVQMMTDHLASMGAVEWPRERYVAEVRRATLIAVDLNDLVPDWRPAEPRSHASE